MSLYAHMMAWGMASHNINQTNSLQRIPAAALVDLSSYSLA